MTCSHLAAVYDGATGVSPAALALCWGCKRGSGRGYPSQEQCPCEAAPAMLRCPLAWDLSPWCGGTAVPVDAVCCWVPPLT